MNYKIILSVLTIAILVLVASVVAIEIGNEKMVPVTDNTVNDAPMQQPQPTCFIGGCSSEICSDQPGAVSTCEYKEEYACYKTARCERQATGQCGWTQTVELTSCLQGK